MTERTRAPGTGGWPPNFPIESSGGVAQGLVVRSVSGAIEGRTTGSRRRCSSTNCPGWFIGVLWESGQQAYLCSEGWRYDPASRTVRVVDGGEISARFVSPAPLGIEPPPPRRVARARRARPPEGLAGPTDRPEPVLVTSVHLT